MLGIKGRNGAFAERLLLPVANLHDVPDDVSTEAASFTEPLAAALQIQEQVDVRPDDRVVVVGAGKLGQLVARTLGLCARDVLVVGRDRARLRTLLDLGLRVGTAESLAPGSADLVVECTGNPEGLALATSAVRPRGTVVLKSTYHGDGQPRRVPPRGERGDARGLALRPLRQGPRAARRRAAWTCLRWSTPAIPWPMASGPSRRRRGPASSRSSSRRPSQSSRTNVGRLPPPALTLMTALREARVTAPTSAPRT